ncbi:MAG: IS21 family transposase [Thermoplasmata archaeon]|nr:MAG: IS21 family transposase [Thermoplasmata archaeon]
MLEMEEIFKIRELRNQGLSLRAIRQETGHTRRTIRKYLNRVEPPVYKKRSSQPGKLDPYKDYIKTRLKNYSLTAVRLHEEINEQGYTGSYSLLVQYVRGIKGITGVTAVYRFETKPGVQSQVDWSEIARVNIDGCWRKIYCFNMVLGYSRMRYIEFTLNVDTASFIRCHLNAFNYFGGYTKEILYDNTKNVVIKRSVISSEYIFNSLFEDFFKYYGFKPRLCRIRRAQTKGKVENMVGYVKRDFIMGREFESLDDINNQRWIWLSKVNNQIHGTTHEIPQVQLEKEMLQPIDSKPGYIIYQQVQRKITRDCYISYHANKYSVPYIYAGREAMVRIHDGILETFIDNRIICTHEILSGRNRVSKNKEHFKGLLKEIRNEGYAPYRKLPLMNFSATDDVEVEKRSLDVYENLAKNGLEGDV